MKIYRTENDWIAAKDRDDLCGILCCFVDEEEAAEEAEDAEELDPDGVLTLTFDDDPLRDTEGLVTVFVVDSQENEVSATHREWAAWVEGRGAELEERIIGSTEW